MHKNMDKITNIRVLNGHIFFKFYKRGSKVVYKLYKEQTIFLKIISLNSTQVSNREKIHI